MTFKCADSLVETFSVAVDNRTREWKVVTDWDHEPFVADSRVLQSSAFVRTQKHQRPTTPEEEDDDRLQAELDDIMLGKVDESSDSEDDVTVSGDQEEIGIQAVEDINPPSTTTSESLSKLTVVALKDKLRIAGLQVSGKKAELIDRLLSA